MSYMTAVNRFALTGDDATGEDVPAVLSLLATLRKRLNNILRRDVELGEVSKHWCWVRACALDPTSLALLKQVCAFPMRLLRLCYTGVLVACAALPRTQRHCKQ